MTDQEGEDDTQMAFTTHGEAFGESQALYWRITHVCVLRSLSALHTASGRNAWESKTNYYIQIDKKTNN